MDNARIAKELVKMAKELSGSERVSSRSDLKARLKNYEKELGRMANDLVKSRKDPDLDLDERQMKSITKLSDDLVNAYMDIDKVIKFL